MAYPKMPCCKFGHVWTEENIAWHITKGRTPVRRCKTCTSDENKSRKSYMRAWQLARKESSAGRPRPDRCDVCGNHPMATDSGKVVCWDHDHESGAFRGWLCNSCNHVLGLVGDNYRILEKLTDYLKAGPRTITRTLIG